MGRARVQALELPHVLDHVGECFERVGRQANGARRELANARVAQRRCNFQLRVEPPCDVLIEEVLDWHAEEGTQPVQVLDGRIDPHAGAQHLEVARRSLVADELLDTVGDLAIGVLTAVRRAKRLEELIQSCLESSRWRRQRVTWNRSAPSGSRRAGGDVTIKQDK